MDFLDIALIAAAAFVGFKFLTGGATTTTTAANAVNPLGQVPIFTPGLPVPTAAPIPNSYPGLGTAPVASPYQVTSAATALAGPPSNLPKSYRNVRNGVVTTYYLQANGSYSVRPPISTPTPSAPPSVVGGISSGVGAGGVPLGGQIVPGVSYGTGTTSIPPARIPLVY